MLRLLKLNSALVPAVISVTPSLQFLPARGRCRVKDIEI